MLVSHSKSRSFLSIGLINCFYLFLNSLHVSRQLGGKRHMVHDSDAKEWPAYSGCKPGGLGRKANVVFLYAMGRHHSKIARTRLGSEQARTTRTRIMAVETSPHLPKRSGRSMDVQAHKPRYYYAGTSLHLLSLRCILFEAPAAPEALLIYSLTPLSCTV